jgi:hypothetical protein
MANEANRTVDERAMNTYAPNIVVVDDQSGHAIWLARRLNERITALSASGPHLHAEPIYPHDLESGELFISRVIDLVGRRKPFAVYKGDRNPPTSMRDLKIEKVLDGSRITTAILDWLVMPPHSSGHRSIDGIELARDLRRMRPELQTFLVTANPYLNDDSVDGVFEKETLEDQPVLDRMVSTIMAKQSAPASPDQPACPQR